MKTCQHNILPETLHEPAPHVMVFTLHTSVLTMLRQSGTEKVFVGLGPAAIKPNNNIKGLRRANDNSNQNFMKYCI